MKLIKFNSTSWNELAVGSNAKSHAPGVFDDDDVMFLVGVLVDARERCQVHERFAIDRLTSLLKDGNPHTYYSDWCDE